MSIYIQRSLLLLVVCLIAACGFHLRGLSVSLLPLPFTTLLLNAPQAAITPSLRSVLSSDPRITLVSSASEAEAILQVVDESMSKDILAINRAGTVNQYQLTYRVVMRITLKGERIEPDLVFTSRRELNYSDQAILGKTQEEDLLWSDMRNDVSRLLLYRLSILKAPVRASSAPVGVRHAGS